MLKLSLVTGTKNRPESFARLVASVVRHTDVPWELIAIDGSDTPVTCDVPQVRIFPEAPRGCGCVKAFNLGFTQTRGEWVIYLNDDAEVCEGYASAAIAFMEAHPMIGLGCLHYSEGDKPFHVNDAWGVLYANFGIIRKSLGRQVGWFDDDLRMYGNDNSLTLRVLMAGHGVADIPEARIIHHSVKDSLREENQKSRRRDNEILSYKYMPYRDRWRRTFIQHYINSKSIPWPHGVKPEMAAK